MLQNTVSFQATGRMLTWLSSPLLSCSLAFCLLLTLLSFLSDSSLCFCFVLLFSFVLIANCLRIRKRFPPSFLPKKKLTLLVSVFCLQVCICMHCLVPMEVYKGTWSCKSWKASIWGWELKPGLPLEQPLCLTAESIVAAPFCPLVFISFHLLGDEVLLCMPSWL